MGFLMTTESRDLGFASHPGDGACLQCSVPIIIGTCMDRRCGRPLLAPLAPLPAAALVFPRRSPVQLPLNETPGRIRCSKKDVVLSRGVERVSARDGERSLHHYFSSLQGLGGFQDHFDWWARNTYSIHGGKPLWIDPFDPQVQHIFIDDNIRLNDSDTIVHPKVFLEPAGLQTRTASTSELYDISLVQTDLLGAISDLGYFTRCVQICEENYEKNLEQAPR